MTFIIIDREGHFVTTDSDYTVAEAIATELGGQVIDLVKEA